jgi:hypothetical protein
MSASTPTRDQPTESGASCRTAAPVFNPYERHNGAQT